jgi:hypothetical protein
MPNWVFNSMTINSTPERCAEIKKKLHESDEQVISFNRILPRPAEEEDNWYNWNIATWGTKWDACHPEIIEDANGRLRYRFDTAWSPPMGVLEAFVNAHPDLDIDYSYEEEQGWGGEMTIRKGELTKHDQYDVPSTHVEINERGHGCYCTDTEAAFADCFYEQAKENGVVDPVVLEAIKGLGADWSGTLDELIEAAKRL